MIKNCRNNDELFYVLLECKKVYGIKKKVCVCAGGGGGVFLKFRFFFFYQ